MEASRLNQDVDDVGRVHERLQAHLSASRIRLARIIDDSWTNKILYYSTVKLGYNDHG